MRNEDKIHISIMEYLDLVLPETWIIFHPPNGGKRNKAEAAKFKRMGVLAGVPDIFILGTRRDGLPATYMIEVKDPLGSLSKPQIEFLECADRINHKYTIARSIDDVRKFIREMDIPTREVQ